MAKFKPGQSGNPAGRPRGVKNSTPNRKELVKLLNDIVNDLIEKSEQRKLSTNQQIRILQFGMKLYEDTSTVNMEDVIRKGFKFEFGQYGRDDDQDDE